MSNYSTVQHFPPVFVSTHHVAMAAFHHSLDSQRPSALQPLRIYPQYLDIRQPTFTPPPVLMHKCQHPGCDRQFNRKYTLAEHEKTHTGEKPHVCPVRTCNKSFSTSGNLSRHKRLHGYIEPLPCPVAGCVCTFTSNNKLAKHMRFHFGSDDVKVCVVSGCGKTFSTTGNLNRHLKAAHDYDSGAMVGSGSAGSVNVSVKGSKCLTPVSGSAPSRANSRSPAAADEWTPHQQRLTGYFEPEASWASAPVLRAPPSSLFLPPIVAPSEESWNVDVFDALATIFDDHHHQQQQHETIAPASMTALMNCNVDVFQNNLQFSAPYSSYHRY